MRMLYIKTSDFDENTIGGSITHTIGMINGFFANGAEEDVLLRKAMPLIRANQIELPIPAQKKPLIIGDYRYHKAFCKAAEKQLESSRKQYDFLYFRHRLMSETGIRLSKRYHIPCVAEFNSFYYTTYKDIIVPAAILRHGKLFGIASRLTAGAVSLMLKRFEKKVLQNADLVVTVSEVLRNELIQFGVEKERILVLPNGVDPDYFVDQPEKGAEVRAKYGIPSDKVVVGFAGTFGNWHGIDELTEAIQSLQDDNLEFLLIGDGMMRKKMEESLRGRSDVHFLGKIPFTEMPSHLSACDILIVSNSWNPNDKRPFFGSPTKLFEYMSMGKGIVASDLEQIGQILENEKTALLFPTGDISAMVSAVRRLSDDAELRKRLGKAARIEAIQNHTWKNNAEKVIAKIGEGKK